MEAFYALIDKVVAKVKEKQGIKEDKWISSEEAMSKLRIKSKTTLQKLRDDGKIRYSQPEKKIILYDLDSIHSYLEKNANEIYDGN
ncbi:MAG: helix-turn-helix domain-containing protein [Saprospiraceae bacterium]